MGFQTILYRMGKLSMIATANNSSIAVDSVCGKPSGTQSIERAASILREIASYNDQGLRLSDLSLLLKLERPTIHRILSCLVREGLVMQDPVTRHYLLGHGLFELGLTAATQFKLQTLCRPSMTRLAEATGEMAFVTIRSGRDAISIERIEGARPVDAPFIEIGVHRPLGVGAGSLALMMLLPDDDITRLCDLNAKRLIRYGGLSTPKLLKIIRQSQDIGYAVHDSSLIPGFCGVGMVINDHKGAPLCALSVTLVSESISTEKHQEIISLLRQESRTIQNLIYQSGGLAH
ncbi:IclR family transcriptional regulator [Pseudomonas sp. R5(2019)]|uniref:IclR family transcriptional regulator n=1 Tax=Pseudomonas sp. R5(2019) TaxID=2697566 RepID=UPI0014134706|nr:IclR family transcriptional regulator [Pseudomonas sp. R5(2019)]NBA93571.1 helix-turn-helix domain-containing protein [Pseudomonas sp. R5(2019)]